MKRNVVLGTILGIIILAILYSILKKDTDSETIMTAQVEDGKFDVYIVTSGELESKNPIKIKGPTGLNRFRIYRIKIDDIVPDGTIVDSGEWVASLDRSEINNSLKDVENELEKLNSQYLKSQLDTTMDMRSARDGLINLKYALEEAGIKVKNSIYEPPATQRQAEIDLDKAKRSLNQAIENYELKRQKAEANMKEAEANMRSSQMKFDEIKNKMDELDVFAPAKGMVVYSKDYEGRKRGTGSEISTWDNVVATMPDLKNMRIKTFVNEIDISKAKTGQKVEINLDAFPEKTYSGEIIEIANIGQQMKNSSAKVFEVIIDVLDYDEVMKPGMTTQNSILTASLDSVIYVPLEAVFSNDSTSYVYSDKKKKEVLLGVSNENCVVIEKGLSSEEEVLLLEPKDPTRYKFVELEK